MKIDFFISEERSKEGVVIPGLCHGDNIVVFESGKENVNDCDALITRRCDRALGVTTADCAPVCFADGQKVGIAHIGWRGLCLGLIEKMLKEFNNDIEIFVGPRLDVFEIQKDSCYETIAEKFGNKFFIETGETIIFNFKDAIASLLPPSAIFDSRNTGDDMTLPSYRRNKTSERLITVVQCKQ